MAAIVTGVVAAHLLGVTETLSIERIDQVKLWFDSLGWWAPLVFVLLWILACIFFLPGLPISIAGGLVFGAVWGTVWTTVGANLGAVAAFLIGRHAARRAVEQAVRRHPALQRIDDGVRRHGWRMLVLTRLVPAFPFNIQNYVYGLTDMPLRTYVVVNIPTMLPATIAYNFAAGSVRTGDFGTTLWYLGIAAAFFVLVSLLPRWLRARFGNDQLNGSVTPK
jgi:uncharacterized membrane protein YdjX (TVP38/TMEM64 family)